MLGSERHRRKRDGLLGIIGTARRSENSAAVAVVAVGEQYQRTFVFVELGDLLSELAAFFPALARFFRCGRRPTGCIARRAQAEWRASRLWSARFIGQLFFRVTMPQRRGLKLYFLRRHRHDDLAAELALVLIEIGVGPDANPDWLARDGSIGRGRPGQRDSNQRLILRLDQVSLEMLVRPAAAERPPLLFACH